jgi:hypothetical protein
MAKKPIPTAAELRSAADVLERYSEAKGYGANSQIAVSIFPAQLREHADELERHTKLTDQLAQDICELTNPRSYWIECQDKHFFRNYARKLIDKGWGKRPPFADPVQGIVDILGSASEGTVDPNRAHRIALRAIVEASDNREGK